MYIYIYITVRKSQSPTDVCVYFLTLPVRTERKGVE